MLQEVRMNRHFDALEGFQPLTLVDIPVLSLVEEGEEIFEDSKRRQWLFGEAIKCLHEVLEVFEGHLPGTVCIELPEGIFWTLKVDVDLVLDRVESLSSSVADSPVVGSGGK